MEIKILDKKENVLLNRTEIEAEIEHSGKPTPSRADIREKLAAMLSADKNLIIIQNLKQDFGSKTKFTAMLYKSKDDLEKAEQKYLIKRNEKVPKGAETQPETKEVSAAPPAEGKEEPAPAEAPKEESKLEEKPAEEKKEEQKPKEEKSE